ncbi:hypothetical protein D3C72_1665260 [compost metagenome]
MLELIKTSNISVETKIASNIVLQLAALAVEHNTHVTINSIGENCYQPRTIIEAGKIAGTNITIKC